MVPKARFLIAILLAAAAAACSGPFVLMPGGSLDGNTAPVPTSWTFTDEIDTIQLETNPADPYSVNIWATALDGSLYVHAGANRAAWIENMETNPNVRLRANDSIYELKASRVESQEEFDRFSAAYEKKYGNPPRNDSVVEAHLYRLGAR